MATESDSGTVSTLGRVRSTVGRYLLARSGTGVSTWRNVLLNPVVFAQWFHARRLYWRATGHQVRTLEDGADAVSEFVREKVLPYNFGNLDSINRDRTERLMLLMRAVRGFDRANAKMLVVGPRNEAELMLLVGHGFRAANLTAIDLFTYAPTIDLMDMHRMTYPDGTFDAVYSSFVVTYSDDIPRAVAETVRVAKDGALIAFAFEHMHVGDKNLFGKNNLSGGPPDLLKLFGESVDHVYWTEDFDRDGVFISSVIFRMKKGATVGRSDRNGSEEQGRSVVSAAP